MTSIALDDAPQVWPSNPQRRAEVVAAMAALTEFLTVNDLPLSNVDIKCGGSGKRWNPATRTFDRPVLPTIQIGVKGAQGMAAWCRALDADTVKIQRRPGVDTCMWADVDRDGFTWSLWGSYGLPLMAGDDVDWDREKGRVGPYGRMTVDAVTALPERVRDVPTGGEL